MDFADFVKPSEGAPAPGAIPDSSKPNAGAKKPIDFSSFLEKPAQSEESKAAAQPRSWGSEGRGRINQEEENPVVIGEGVPPEAHASLKSVAQEGAALADLPLALPAMVAKNLGFTGGILGEGAGALKTGTPITRKELLVAGAKTGEELAAPLADPAKRLLRYLGYGEDVDETAIDHAAGVFMQWAKKGNAWIEQKTGGMVNAEEADQIENALLAGGSAELYKSVKGKLPKGAEPAAARVEPGPLPPRETAAAPTEADDFIKRMDKESAELAKEAGQEEIPSMPAGKPRIKPKPGKPAEEATQEERPFADTKKWETSKLEKLATAAEKRIEESRTKFEESKATDRRRRMKSLATEEHAEGTKRLEDELKQLQEELGARKSNKTAAAAIAAGVGVGAAVTAVIATNPDVKNKAGTAAIAAAALFGFPRESIGALYKAADSGGRVLERLAERAPEKSVYKKAEIVSEMNRQDIPKAEQDIIRGLLGKPGDTISAEELVQGFKLATQNFELKPVETEKYNDLGIENIRPSEFFTEDQEARTTIWKLPESWNIPPQRHFKEMGTNQYGHTRSFEEGGVRHVVEVQSDLLQPQKSTLTVEERQKLLLQRKTYQAEIEKITNELHELHKVHEDKNSSLVEKNRVSVRYAEQYRLRQGIRARIEDIEDTTGGGKVEGLDPIAKQWPRRLIQEELARAGREGLKKIRFASADTVALVESWSQPIKAAKERLRNLEELDRLQSKQSIGPAKQTRDLIAHEKELIKGLEVKGQRFSDRDQPIYDRYKDEITKYLKSLGAKDYTDPHGHTWLELPTKPGVPPRQFGKADPKLIAGVGIGAAVGAYAASDDHKVGGAAAGALGGALLVGLFASRMFAKAEGGVRARALSEELDKITGRTRAKLLELLKFAGSIPKDYKQHAEEIYHSLEDPTIKLSPRAAELKFKYVDPIMRQNALLREVLKKSGLDVGEDVDSYVHRILKGEDKSPVFEQFERASPQGRTLSQFAPPLEERTTFKLVDTDSGDSLFGIKDEKTNDYKVYKNGKVVGEGKISPKLWKEGKVPLGGRVLARAQATTKELETHTPLRYQHDALQSAIASNARLSRVWNNNVFLKGLLKDSALESIALKSDAPKDWREVPQIPQLRGYKFVPRVANVLEDFAAAPGSDLAEGIAKVSRILTGSLFWNPLPHIWNVLNHAVIRRGLVGGWLNPTAYPRLMRTTIRAAKAVTEQSDEYLRFVKEGAGLMYPNVLLNDFSEKVLSRLGHQPEMGLVAKAWGYVSPTEMVKRIYAFSRKSLWAANDILMMQAYLEEEMIRPEKAIAEVEKHIPNYKVPDVVLGQRMISQALNSPVIAAFGRYDYGRMRSYGEMAKGLLGKDKTIKDRAKALDQIAMLTFTGAVVYPLLLDNVAKALTGNPNAEATRFGASTIPYLLYSYLHGKKQFSQVLASAFPVGMALKSSIELVSNRDLYTGKHLIEDYKDFADYVAKQLSPLGTAARIESGQLTPGQFTASAVGIRSPMTTAQKKDLAAKRLREKTRKRVDQLLGR